MEKEIWKPFEKHGRKFEVSSFGNIRSVSWVNKTGRVVYTKGVLLKLKINDRGYKVINIRTGLKAPKRKRYTVHRIVCTAFHSNIENKPQINHKDLNQLNNMADNLEWATAKENTIHAHKNVVGMYKYSEDQVKEIRHKVEQLGMAEVARQMNEHYSCIRKIATFNRAMDDFTIRKVKKMPYKYKKVIDTSTGDILTTKDLEVILGKSNKEVCRRLNGERPNNTKYLYV